MKIECVKLQMRIPTEHFSKVPVSSLSPALSPRDEEKELLPGSRTPTPNSTNGPTSTNNKPAGRKNSVGSAPTSPNMSRKSIGTDSDSGQRSISPGLLESEERDRFSPDHGNGPYSLPTVTSISLGLMAFKRYWILDFIITYYMVYLHTARTRVILVL